MTRSPYRVFNDPSSTCKCGASVALLSSGMSWLPAFYICATCGHVGQVGVGPVRGRIKRKGK